MNRYDGWGLGAVIGGAVIAILNAIERIFTSENNIAVALSTLLVLWMIAGIVLTYRFIDRVGKELGKR